MTSQELTDLLNRLIAGWENEIVEFKTASNQFSAEKTGEYVSALSNEAKERPHEPAVVTPTVDALFEMEMTP